MKKKYQIWYTPYGLDGESDYVEGEFESKDEAYRYGGACGWVEEVIEL